MCDIMVFVQFVSTSSDRQQIRKDHWQGFVRGKDIQRYGTLSILLPGIFSILPTFRDLGYLGKLWGYNWQFTWDICLV